MDEIDLDWQQFCDDEYEVQHQFTKSGASIKKSLISNDIGHEGIPKSNALYISTQTIISYLNMEVDLKDVFWKLPIIPYALPKEGIVKKQIKFNSQSKEELAYIGQQLLK